MSEKCRHCGFTVGDKVHMRSANMPGKILRGTIGPWQASCGHLASWEEIADKEGGEFKSFLTAEGGTIMATPTFSQGMGEKNTNVVLVTEALPVWEKPS
jgi:hypothetical protein